MKAKDGGPELRMADAETHGPFMKADGQKRGGTRPLMTNFFHDGLSAVWAPAASAQKASETGPAGMCRAATSFSFELVGSSAAAPTPEPTARPTPPQHHAATPPCDATQRVRVISDHA